MITFRIDHCLKYFNITILPLVLLLPSFYIIQAQVPPGTIILNDSTYIDRSPVTNEMYIEYLNYKEFLKEKGGSSFKDFIEYIDEKTNTFPTLISPILLKDFYANNKYFIKKKYYNHNRYDKHPLLNITKKQAAEYCEWRSKMVNHLWVNKFYLTNIKTDIINYRLPKENELIEAKYFFTHSKKIIELNQELLKIKTNKLLTNYFIIFPINEFTDDDGKLFNKKSNSAHTGFRCICEFKI